MYEYTNIQDQLTCAQEAAKKYINRYGVYVYVDVDPDWASPDFFIDQADTEGIAIFREFAARMAAHYKSLNKEAAASELLDCLKDCIENVLIDLPDDDPRKVKYKAAIEKATT